MSTPAPTDLASLRAALEADPDLIALREVLRHHLAEDPQGETAVPLAETINIESPTTS